MTGFLNTFPTILVVVSLICGISSEDIKAAASPALIAAEHFNNINVTSADFDGESGLGNSSSRTKRNTVNSNSVEGLLASCQLTNLLLYQALQQQRQAQANPLLALATQNLQGLGSNLNLNSLPIASGLNLNPGGQNLGGIANLLNPFPGAINQNLIFPAAATLQTYTTTTTFVTKLTTTGVVTVPLLFGNKVSSTTITRTKTYDVTTSSIQTLTSTIKPTVATTAQEQPIAPTSVQAASDVVVPTKVDSLSRPSKAKLAVEYEEYYEEPEANYQNDVQADLRPSAGNTKRGQVRHASKVEPVQETAENIRVPEKLTVSSKASKLRGGDTSSQKRRKTRPSQSQAQPSTQSPSQSQRSPSRYGQNQKDDTLIPLKQKQKYEPEEDYYTPRASEKRNSNKDNLHDNQFYNRQYGTLQEDDVAVDEDPAAAQYPDDYSYYARRLKRGEQGGEADDEEYSKLDREYLLEPSSDGDYSGNYQKYEKCPPIPANDIPTTVTVTSIETRTITKFLKGQSTATPTASINNNYYGNPDATTTTRGFTPSSRSRTSYKRDRDSVAAASYPAAAPIVTSTSERTTTDRRAQILRRSRSRYTPSQDYEYRG